jgi:hypothetical protein
MVRNIVSVVVGFVVWTVLWLGSNQVVRLAMPDVFGDDGSIGSAGVLVGFVVLSFVFSVVAGYTTASLSSGNSMKPALALAVIQVVIGVFVQSMYWNILPLWYHLAFLVLLAPGILLGARMRVVKGHA